MLKLVSIEFEGEKIEEETQLDKKRRIAKEAQ